MELDASDYHLDVVSFETSLPLCRSAPPQSFKGSESIEVDLLQQLAEDSVVQATAMLIGDKPAILSRLCRSLLQKLAYYINCIPNTYI